MKTSSGKNKLQTRLVKKSTFESASLFSLKRLATLVLILGVLYWARDVFIPFALATLLSFLLGPLVTRLRRRGFGRVLSVSIVTVLAFALLFSLTWVVTRQLLSFAREFPSYKRNIQSKLQWLNGPFSQELDRTSRAIKGLQLSWELRARAMTNNRGSTSLTVWNSSSLHQTFFNLCTEQSAHCSSQWERPAW